MRGVALGNPLLRRRWRVPVLLGLVVGALLLQVASAGAVPRPAPRAAAPQVRGNTEMKVTDWSPGQGVTGFIANSGNSFDPATDPYPPSNPTTGWTAKNEGFAGVIHGMPTGGGATLNLYCIDINTDTTVGIGYELGSWDAGGVSPRVGYVARLLNDYYPHTNEPAALTNLNQKAAAVQAAIWFFSDRYVVNTSDAVHAAVVAIVNKVKADGPLIEPPPPSLTITPPSVSGPAGSAVGPFTVSTNPGLRRRRRPRATGDATVTATGGSMFSDAAGTVPIATGATVPSGQKIWMRSSGGASSAVLQAKATATVPSGNVYLYDGNAGVSDAQRLILAENATLTTTVQATANFFPVGSLEVKKTIAGPAAGSQGRVVIHVACTDGKDRPDFVIDAGMDAGTTSKTYHDIPAGTMCSVTETSDGSTTATKVIVTGAGQQVTIPSDGSKTVDVTDTYHFAPGSLIVTKTIAGPAAGEQEEIRIHTECGGKALTPDFVIDPRTPAGDRSKRYDDIPAPTTCKVTETADGHTSAVSVAVQGSGQTVHVGAGEIVNAGISDTYGLVPGQLEVTKTITGPAAGSQGQVVIHTVCNGTPLPDFVIAAGTPAGNQSHIYSNIPTPADCVVTETTDGQTNTVSVDVTGSPQTPATIPGGGAGAAHISDTYRFTFGSLLVRKTITGPGAGQQGEITIHTECNGTALTPDFVIDPRTPAGEQFKRYDEIPAGADCIVTETADGHTSAVSVVVEGSGQTVSVPAGGVVEAYLSDAFGLVPGQLAVTKTVAGPAAGQQGRAVIHTVCNGTALTPDFVIPATTPAGNRSHIYSHVPTPANCVVTETADGHTSTVPVVVTGSPHTATIPPGGAGAAQIIDTYGTKAGPAPSPVPGSLLVTKTISGPRAGHQGPVIIHVTCNGTVLSSAFVIRARTRARSVSHSFDGVPAGSVCTVAETRDGATAKVTATVAGNDQMVTVPAGKVVPVSLIDVYQGTLGFLRVTKKIAGRAARQHGHIAILVTCGGPLRAVALRIRPRTRGGSVTRWIAGLPAGSRCTVVEVAAGRTSNVAVVAIGRRQKVTIRANRRAVVHLTDKFSRIIKVPIPRVTG